MDAKMTKTRFQGSIKYDERSGTAGLNGFSVGDLGGSAVFSEKNCR